MKALVTGAAGFIGFHLCRALLARGDRVLGVDDMNDYYDVTLKEARLAELTGRPGFRFVRADIADRAAMTALAEAHPDVTHVVNLAAQAGVRYSLVNPYAYVQANVMGLTVLLETARRWDRLAHFVYASSSSVYGTNDNLPFAVGDRVDHPISLYAATKKSGELIAHTYAHLYRIPCTGLRFFTVYGPWGRPDMAAFIFTRKILAGESIPVFNHGNMRRDFTYIDDIVAGVVAVLGGAPADTGGAAPARIYNIGNHRSENLLEFIGLIERELGIEATKNLLPMQPGDVAETYADIAAIQRDFGFAPKTSIAEGVPAFIRWYKDFHGV